MTATLLTLAASTLVSEDLACIAAGVLIARGDVSPAAGVIACALGIYAGDCGLWALGRFGRVLAWRLRIADRGELRSGSARSVALLVLASRFTPGMRLPLYVAAGVQRVPFTRFAFWTGIAVVLWTPVVVLAGAQAGAAGAQAGDILGAVVGGVVGVVGFVRVTRVLADTTRRASLVNSVRRLRRWEFWPPWLFYAPVVAWIGWLIVRYRGAGPLTTCNPGIADGGFVGESKTDILSRLPAAFTIPGCRVAAGSGNVPGALGSIASAGWTFPLVLKPDVGQRGVGVRLVRSADDLTRYLSLARGDVLMQPFHEGPNEAGIYYYRHPDERRGRILSITHKVFPFIVGDGVSTVRHLIESHPRYRLQSGVFLARHASSLDRVLPEGERMQLALAGNHAQGTTFRDGWHLWTPALEERIDSIARQYHGFFIGRFDVRYRDVEAFMAGEDLAIVELNGATAEPTNLYDPDASLWSAYRLLFRHWSLVFAIGAINQQRGARPTSTKALISLVAAHLTSSPAHALAD